MCLLTLEVVVGLCRKSCLNFIVGVMRDSSSFGSILSAADSSSMLLGYLSICTWEVCFGSSGAHDSSLRNWNFKCYSVTAAMYVAVDIVIISVNFSISLSKFLEKYTLILVCVVLFVWQFV